MTWDEWSAVEAAQAKAAQEDAERRLRHEAAYLRLVDGPPPDAPEPPVVIDTTEPPVVVPGSSTGRTDPPGWRVYRPPPTRALSATEGVRAWAARLLEMMRDDAR